MHFAAPVQYATAQNALHFDPALLQLPTATHDKAYAPLMHVYLEQMQPRLKQDIAASTRQLIGTMTPSAAVPCIALALLHVLRESRR